MTTEEKVARRKLSLLELAQELGNVSKACRVMGYSRQHFYEIRRNYQLHGADGLLDRLPGPKGPHPNRVSEEIEKKILEHCLKHPTKGCLRVAQDLVLEGIQVSSTGVRGVWSRHGLLTRQERLLRLEKMSRARKIPLTDEQLQALEKWSIDYRERHIEAKTVGDPLAVDTFFVGHLKGVGKIYMQSAIDCRSRYAFGRLYTSKMPITAAHLLHSDVLPFYEAQEAPLRSVLSDNGREYCGRPDTHPYQLLLQLHEIEHKRTRVGRPQSNGIVERFHRTVLDEHFRIQGRTKWYERLEEMQKDLESYLDQYNRRRPHQGYNMGGKTPWQVFQVERDKLQKKARKEDKKTA